MLKPQNQSIPVWMQSTTVPDWPTQPVSSAELGYSIRICSRWQITPTQHQTAVGQEHVYVGALPGEMLAIAHMSNANPNHDLSNWVEAFISLTRLPSVHLMQIAGGTAQLIEWQRQNSNSLLKEHLQVDELLLYQGLAQVASSSFSGYIRIHTLLLRRQTKAWKVMLSLSSACRPDMPEELIERNDHVRADASLGALTLASE